MQKSQSISKWSDLYALVPATTALSLRTNHTSPSSSSQTSLNMDAIESLINIPGLRDGDYDTSIAAHDEFMEQVKSIIQEPKHPSQLRLEEARKRNSRRSQSLSPTKPHANNSYNKNTHHSDSNSVRKSSSTSSSGQAAVSGGLLEIAEKRRISIKEQKAAFNVFRTLPFDRSEVDIQQTTEWAHRNIKSFQSLPLTVVKGLVEIAKYEMIPDANWPLPGDYTQDLCSVILSGSVHLIEPFELTTDTDDDNDDDDDDDDEDEGDDHRHTPTKTHLDSRVNRNNKDETNTFTTNVGLHHERECRQGDLIGARFAPAARIITGSKAEFLHFRPADYEAAVAKVETMNLQRKQSALQLVSATSECPRSLMRESCHHFEWTKVKAGEVLCRAGTVAPFFAIVVKGECEVFKDLMVANRKRSVSMGLLRAGDYLGEGSHLGAGDASVRENLNLDLTASMSKGTSPGSSNFASNHKDSWVEEYTIRCSTNVVLLTLPPNKVDRLDPLFWRHFVTKGKFTHLSENEIKDVYTKQMEEKAWKTLRATVSQQVLSRRKVPHKHEF